MRNKVAIATSVRLGMATPAGPNGRPPRAKPEKDSGIAAPKIVLPSEMRNARPLNTVSAPSVAMKGRIPT